MLEQVAARIPPVAGSDPVLVAIDGVDAAGKTVFADELAGLLRVRGRAVARVSVDDFLRPPEDRHRRGRHSPSGYFLDSFDYDLLRRVILEPRRPGTVLVVDGIFVHRDELADLWQLSIYLDVPFDVSVARMAARDDISPDPGDALVRRYVDGQRLYLERCHPRGRADIVIDNTDWDRPTVVGLSSSESS